MINYQYPKVSGGYRWNLLKRCLWEVGVEPLTVCDISNETWVSFTNPLTTQQKSALDVLMADNPQHPKSSSPTVLKIVDIWEKFDAFKATVGLPNLRLYYSESVPGSGNVDQIELHHPTPLSQTEKNKIKTAYNNLLS